MPTAIWLWAFLMHNAQCRMQNDFCFVKSAVYIGVVGTTQQIVDGNVKIIRNGDQPAPG